MSLDERVAILEERVSTLTRVSADLAGLLREHMEREEATTRELMESLYRLDQRMARWHGIAVGAGMVVSAMWAAIGMFFSVRS